MKTSSTTKPVILGLAGTEVSSEERDFFAEADPFGFILFQRNCETKEQVAALCANLREVVDRDDAPILIDQEGGRVQRLRAPVWQEMPAVRNIGRLAESDLEKGKRAAYLQAQIIAIQLRKIGVTVNCAPCLDLTIPGAHEIIGDRSYGADPALIRSLGLEASRGYVETGVVPVIKHLPGHGRASVDSHHDLPVISTDMETLRQMDFAAFEDHHPQAWGMTGHLKITELDAHDCVTLSPDCIENVIRKAIGFDGLLMSDDLSMKALSGTLGERTAASLSAGCDIALHCNGDMKEMQEVVANCTAPSDDARRRMAASNVAAPPHLELEALVTEFSALITA